MSVPARITLGVAVAISSAIIGYVHYKQTNDRIKLHEGVLRDVEQQKRRQNENTYHLQQQIDMTKRLQDIHGSSPNSTHQTVISTEQNRVLDETTQTQQVPVTEPIVTPAATNVLPEQTVTPQNETPPPEVIETPRIEPSGLDNSNATDEAKVTNTPPNNT